MHDGLEVLNKKWLRGAETFFYLEILAVKGSLMGGRPSALIKKQNPQKSGAKLGLSITPTYGKRKKISCRPHKL